MSNQYFIRAFEEKAKSILFLFPYAGGGASVYNQWQKFFVNTEVIAAQYPGRETRIKERPIENMRILVTELFDSIKPIISETVPYYLFGHSLGTKVVYELALLIQKSGLNQPSGLIIAAGKAPCLKEDNPIHQLDDNDFINEIGRFSATPTSILQSKELIGVFLPMLRADFKLDETYHRSNVEKVNVPILALMGTNDPELTIDELLMWKDYTNCGFTCKSVTGTHMFIISNQEAVINTLHEFINT